jgi:hypothetical protein
VLLPYNTTIPSKVIVYGTHVHETKYACISTKPQNTCIIALLGWGMSTCIVHLEK